MRGGEGAQSPSGTGLGCGSCSVGEGNPGALRIGVVLCLLFFFFVLGFFPPFPIHSGNGDRFVLYVRIYVIAKSFWSS